VKRGEKLWVRDSGEWVEATYEFRVTTGEPLGHHSVMLANGGGRRVVCGCKTSTEAVPHRSAEAYVDDGEIVIRVAVSTLPLALECNPRDYDDHSRFSKHISDLAEFTKDVVSELNREAEDGTTLIHELFDDALAKALDGGSIGIDYDAAEKERQKGIELEAGGR
jgi:hypothetical protein